MLIKWQFGLSLVQIYILRAKKSNVLLRDLLWESVCELLRCEFERNKKRL